MSRSTHWVLLCLAVTCSAMAATLFIMFEIRTGLPYGFGATLTVAALVAVALPVLCVLLGRRLGIVSGRVGSYLVYYGVCLIGGGVFLGFLL